MARRASRLTIACGSALALLSASSFAGGAFIVDLTHPIPTFQPMEGDPMKPDMSKPWLDSTAIPSFGQQTVLSIGQFPTNQGHFDLGTLVLSEHHGTHIDSSAHYVNNADSQEAGNPAADQRKYMHMLDGGDLSGTIVLVDISARIQAELDRNGGRPSPDTSVTNFSDDSGNAITADDISAVADQIDDGVWLVLSQGWSRFYFQGTDFVNDPYINGWNHPGINKAAVDRLIEIMETKGVKIAGIIADNIGIDSGESAIGVDDKWSNSWHAHVRLLQRGILFVENATNLGQVAMAGDCTIVVGAPKHVRGTGGPSRVMAICSG
jgi:kynurenine formamidase